MKIKTGFHLRQIAGANVVVATGEAAKAFKGIINLNDSAATLFDRLLQGATEEELIQTLLAEYEVDTATAKSSIERFIKELAMAQLLEA